MQHTQLNMTVGQRKESAPRSRVKTKSHRTNQSLYQARPGDIIEELMHVGRRPAGV